MPDRVPLAKPRVLTAEEVAAMRPPLEADATPIGRDWVEYANALARSHELLRRRGWACDYHHPEFVAGCTGCVKREARAEKAPA